MLYFDTLIHSGKNVNWPKKNNDINVINILKLIDESKYLYGAIVQDSPYFDQSPDYKYFVDIINKYNGSKRIFCCLSLPKFLNLEIYKDYIDDAMKLNVNIFKIHPRFIDLDQESLLKLLDYMVNKNLSIQICSYGYSRIGNQLFLCEDSFWEKFLKIVSNARKNSIMLMHMGGTEILKIHNYIRHCDALIGDLSMTYLKYLGSSVSDDIGFILRNFDQRICIGSDFPEYEPKQIVDQVKLDAEKFSIKEDKLENFLIKNALRFAENS